MATAPTPPQPDTKQKAINGGGLVALVGVLAASILYTAVPKEEGTEYKAYQDIAGIWTLCSGDTYDVHPGQVASQEECTARLTRQLIAHAEPTMKCAPTLRDEGRDYQRAAFVLDAYNIGTGLFCKSSMAAEANKRHWIAACNNLGKYDKARVAGKLVVVRGLTLRRKRETEICLTGLVPGKTPENMAARVNSVR